MTKMQDAVNRVQTRCIVKARLGKVHFSGDFLGFFFCILSGSRLFSRDTSNEKKKL